MMSQERISSSLEDYLEAIAAITAEQGHAHTREIAERLGVTMPSVTNALQSLATRNLVRYASHQPVVLTAEGAKRAAIISRRHQVLRNFFCGALKLDEKSADDIACKLEHIVEEEALSRMVILSEAISHRTDCAELRAYLDATLPQLTAEPVAEKKLLLSDLKEGERGVIVAIDASLHGLRKFADLGMVSGMLVEMEGRAPFGNLIRVKVLGSSLSLRECDAAHIKIKKTN